ncbi:hypothetical protein PHLCEN_2v586 [Hermanssonia centrifuga]|uniref:Uncharacterized protein n=1 Tax=Hermanssonia centrifuga TaxID=98765 RepID=A0A2R6S5J8_9APHY|nr:hypothetical protein PHLCEN_2v586 [Hermanssonia centrifuga]
MDISLSPIISMIPLSRADGSPTVVLQTIEKGTALTCWISAVACYNTDRDE